jgi:hypothetical protein
VSSKHPRQRLDTVPLERRLADYDIGGGTIADTTGVASRHCSILLEHRGELGERLEGRLGPRVLVLRKLLGFSTSLARRDRDGSDLSLECSSVKS